VEDDPVHHGGQHSAQGCANTHGREHAERIKAAELTL
jgi:hypothetical protein